MEESPWLGVPDLPEFFGPGTICTMLATLAKLLMLPLAPAPGVGMAPMFIMVEATF